MDALFVDEASAGLYGLGSAILQHLQLIGGLAYQGTQRHSNGKPNHACAGNAYPHGILQNVGTQLEGNLLRSAAQYLGSLGNAQGNGNRLGTPNGWYNFGLHQSDNLLSFGICHHRILHFDTKVGITSRLSKQNGIKKEDMLRLF